MTNSFTPVESHLNATTTTMLAAQVHLQMLAVYVIENWFANMQNYTEQISIFSMLNACMFESRFNLANIALDCDNRLAHFQVRFRIGNGKGNVHGFFVCKLRLFRGNANLLFEVQLSIKAHKFDYNSERVHKCDLMKYIHTIPRKC